MGGLNLVNCPRFDVKLSEAVDLFAKSVSCSSFRFVDVRTKERASCLDIFVVARFPGNTLRIFLCYAFVNIIPIHSHSFIHRLLWFFQLSSAFPPSNSEKQISTNKCRPPPDRALALVGRAETVGIVPPPVHPPAMVQWPLLHRPLAEGAAFRPQATQNRSPRRIQRSAKRSALRPSESRRNWPRSRWTRHRTAVPDRRVTICTNGCRRFLDHPDRFTRVASFSWTSISRPSIRSSRPRLISFNIYR